MHQSGKIQLCLDDARVLPVSLVDHGALGWMAFVEDQASQDQPVEFGSYVVLMSRDTLENWQSEFLQLLWQAGGLAYPEEGQRIIENIDQAYAGRETDPGYKRKFS